AAGDPRRPRPHLAPLAGEEALNRRGAIGAILGAAATVTAVIAGLSLLARGSYRPARTLSASAPATTARAPASATTSTTAAETTGTNTAAGTSTAAGTRAAAGGQALPSGAVRLGAGSQLPNGQAALYRDPGNGQPDVVIRQTNGTLVAHSAVCTHAGCTVGYQGGQLVCPCHGSIFNAQTGAVVTGPAVTPLPARTVLEHAGEIYALPA
ncbi:MAG TPA: Rieske (2Fe-2S) protein, partial [Solirubrobacteraceae bacterium]